MRAVAFLLMVQIGFSMVRILNISILHNGIKI
jgi:hypothetical protein